MKEKRRAKRPSGAMIVAFTALLIALAGSAWAAGLAKNSVKSKQIKDGQVKTVDLAGDAVDAAKISGNAVGSAEIVDGSVGASELADGAATGAKIDESSLDEVPSAAAADVATTAGVAGQIRSVFRDGVVASPAGLGHFTITTLDVGEGPHFVIAKSSLENTGAAPATPNCRLFRGGGADIDDLDVALATAGAQGDTAEVVLTMVTQVPPGGGVIAFDCSNPLNFAGALAATKTKVTAVPAASLVNTNGG
jgi:hypothetical protein